MFFFCSRNLLQVPCYFSGGGKMIPIWVILLWKNMDYPLSIIPLYDPNNLHPGKLTWNLRIHLLKRKILFQTIIFRFYVNLRGCISSYNYSTNPICGELFLFCFSEAARISVIPHDSNSSLSSCPIVFPRSFTVLSRYYT